MYNVTMVTNLPRHNIGAICSQVSFDKVTHSVHLFNIQNVFQTPTLPATLSQFVVANQWTNAQGTFLQQLEVYNPTGREKKPVYNYICTANFLPLVY
jgi:hypothetical protein